VEVIGADTNVVRCGMVFGVVISHVFLSGVPLDVELLAGYLVGDPKIAHFHGVGALAFDCIVGIAHSGGVVTMNGC